MILAEVRRLPGLSRAELARTTGLSRPALEARIRDLQQRGLLRDVGLGPSRGGRRPRVVAFDKEAGYVVAVDLGLTSVDVAITNLDADVRIHLAQPVDVRDGPHAVLPTIQALIERAIGDAALDRPIKGLGMGIPGPVEFRTALPVSPPNMPGWHCFPLREHLEATFGWPVFVDNDVNIMALGERWKGLGRQEDSFLWIKIGTGIGCGIIAGGHVYRGADGCAGDLGHVSVGNDDTLCACGHRGCLGALAGGAALAWRMEAAARAGESPLLARLLQEKGSLAAEDLTLLLERGDAYAVALVRQAGAHIGQVLAGMVNFYNPRLIIIGGGVANLGDLLLASIREAIYRRSLPLATRHLAIHRSVLGGTAGVVGAAAMVLTELFQFSPPAAASAAREILYA